MKNLTIFSVVLFMSTGWSQREFVDSSLTRHLVIGKASNSQDIPIGVIIDKKKYKVKSFESVNDTLLRKGGAIFTGGKVAKHSWKGYELTNTMTVAEVQSNMIKVGFTKSFSVSNAPKILKEAKSIGVKGALIALSAGGAGWAVLEVTSPQMPLWHKGLYILLFVLAVLGLYIYFRRKGIMS